MKSSRRSFIKASTMACLSTGFAADVLANEIEPPKNGLVFLFQGDSVTDGNRGRDQSDLNHVMGHGYASNIAARIGADFPHNNFHFYNRGISGNTVAQLNGRWQTDALDIKPDVLSILVGVNDTNAYIRDITAGDQLNQFEADYRSILSQSKQQNPDLLIVVGLPFVYPGSRTNEHVDLWKNSVNKRREIVKKLAIEFNAIIVDYPAMFDKAIKDTSVNYWIWDGVHPTVPAHELMAREWIKQVSERLKFLKIYKYK
ncbi:SGNH/GDSL hydrolase family protein [Mucilaginibacter agri]|uniref:Twin-arginine translocation signal domain-containing protein n=1 Tax=Mucilaginibacter agri TaxID=2695265 RepID=A0A966DVF3_9SPHI|nr:SGNH/GDSL hydrolase family protein [Mucilaginibacter agri]NCD71392.1 twin-arginine translocation signal domain-containing protein [Mucilaginibacter agri]